ncbi:MAG: type-F conjugative transfer system pilin assembly protein TrbC [Rhodospirillales bacterium]|nr:type-F conjugative transfer system pilin assembly protein TrbC [Rhodospirillales bacterium]
MSARHLGAVLVAAAATLVCGSSASAAEANSGYADLARKLAEEAADLVGGEALDAWSRTVLEPALPAVRDDATAQARGAATGDVLLFTSLSVPAASWRASARDAALIGAPLVLRGVAGGSLPETARRIAGRLGDARVGVAIDPRLFRLFGVERVPAVVVVPGGVPSCRQPGCAGDAPPPFDRVSGNLSLAAALEAVAAEGDAGRAVARRHLSILRGAER